MMREILYAWRKPGKECLGRRLPLNSGELSASVRIKKIKVVVPGQPDSKFWLSASILVVRNFKSFRKSQIFKIILEV